MKEVKLKLVESFCTQDESARPNVFCKLVSGVLSPQEIQQLEETYPFNACHDHKVELI